MRAKEVVSFHLHTAHPILCAGQGKNSHPSGSRAVGAGAVLGTINGRPVSVIIPIKDYEELLDRVEDARDIAWLKRTRRKPLHYRPLEDHLAGQTVF
jgi:hypothetical protein